MKNTASVLSLALLVSFVAACGGPARPARVHLPESHPVSGEQAIRLVIRGALLVDVSDRMSYYGRHVRGAHNIPLDELEERMHELPRDRPIVVYCRDGRVSPRADLLLRAAGFDVHLLGSFADWGG